MKLLSHDLHTLSGAYAVDALDPAEREKFERHMNRCQECSHEVRGLQATATGLAMSAAQVPPPELKRRVLTAAARTRQLPPVSEHRAVVQRRRPQWMPRLAVAVGAAGMAVVIALGITLARTQNELDSARAQQHALAAVLNSPGATMLSARTTLGGSATIVVSRQLREVIFTSEGLPALPGKKVYQLWLMAPHHIVSAGLLPQPANGRMPPVLASGLLAGDKIGVTVEPAGGTAQPTTSPIVVIPTAS
ncbi:MAG: anti-sigma factor domain-containing protein [Streptosporangiaceae bacterium]